MTNEYDAKIDSPGMRAYRSERTLEEIKRICPGLARLAERLAKASPWKWDIKEILGEREKSLGAPLKDTFEALREQQTVTPFADNLAAMRGQSVPQREPLERYQEPDTQITRYKSDYDRPYDQPGITPLRDTIEAIRGREETPGNHDSYKAAYEKAMHHDRTPSPGSERKFHTETKQDTPTHHEITASRYKERYKIAQEHDNRRNHGKEHDHDRTP